MMGKEEQELQAEEELMKRLNQESSTPPGCRFPSDLIEEDFFLSQVLGV